MRGQLALLTALQKLDNQLRSLRREQQALPRQLETPERAHNEACEELESIRAEIDRNERQQHDLEMELQSTQDALDKVQRKLREVKTNKEYSAVLAEIDVGKQQMTRMEDQLLQLMEQAEQKRQTKRLQEQRVRATRGVLEEQGHVVEQASELLNQKILVEREKRLQTVVGLNVDLLAVYEKLTAQNDGSVVVHLNDGVCGGCHLKVQPQLVSEIRLQESLHTCPYCRLILLWPDECPELEG